MDKHFGRLTEPTMQASNLTEFCDATEPSPTCNKKAAECPPDGYYWATFHVCGCCAGPEVIRIRHENVESFDGGIVPWAHFNGHIIPIDASVVAIGNPERVDRVRRDWQAAVQSPQEDDARYVADLVAQDKLWSESRFFQNCGCEDDGQGIVKVPCRTHAAEAELPPLVALEM